MLKVLVFDLDDTLYLERDFVASGFKAAGNWLKTATGLEGLEQLCATRFAAGQRTEIFDTALATLDAGAPREIIGRLVNVYRTHHPEISLADDARRYLLRRNSGVRRAVITDGHLATQSAKLNALGLTSLLDVALCTDQWGREFWKPHPRSFAAVETEFSAAGTDLVYVADNPAKDFLTPRARGWLTIQIARPQRIHHLNPPTLAHKADAAISTLDALDDAIGDLTP